MMNNESVSAIQTFEFVPQVICLSEINKVITVTTDGSVCS